MFATIESSRKESRTIVAQRDALLPKLVSEALLVRDSHKL